MKSIARLPAFLCLSALAGCGTSTVASDAHLLIDRPPPLDLCEPGEDPRVNSELVGECTALTRSVGDWILQTDAVLKSLEDAQ